MESHYVVENGVLQVRGYCELFEKRSEIEEDGQCPKCHAIIDEDESK